MSPPTNEGIVAGEADGGVDKSRMDVIRSRSRQVRLIFVLEGANLSQSDYQIV